VPVRNRENAATVMVETGWVYAALGIVVQAIFQVVALVVKLVRPVNVHIAIKDIVLNMIYVVSEPQIAHVVVMNVHARVRA
jgi:hypothetical protein